MTFNRSDTNWAIAVNLHAFWLPHTSWRHLLSRHSRRNSRCHVTVPVSNSWGVVQGEERKAIARCQSLKTALFAEWSQWITAMIMGIPIKQLGSWRQEKIIIPHQSSRFWLPWHGGEYRLLKIANTNDNLVHVIPLAHLQYLPHSSGTHSAASREKEGFCAISKAQWKIIGLLYSYIGQQLILLILNSNDFSFAWL